MATDRPAGGTGPASGHQARGAGAMPPAGVRVLVPGLAHWAWGQNGRALGFCLGYAASLALAARSWGTAAGVIALVAAFAIHAASAADALRQNASPGLSRGATWLGVAFGLALGFYGPLLLSSSFLNGSWDRSADAASRWVKRPTAPAADDLIWYSTGPDGEARVGRVAAGPRDKVQWKSGRLLVNGLISSLGNPFRSSTPPEELSYRVPEGHVLVHPGAEPNDGQGPKKPAEGLVIVPDGQILGRAWLRMHPRRASQSIQ